MQGSIFIYSQSKNALTAKVTELLESIGLAPTNVPLRGHSANVNVLTVEIFDGKKSIGIAQSKEVLKFLQEKPLKGKAKAVIIKDADKMTIEAQNALLKVLEEPPSWATLILCGKNKNSMLPTVLSRCRLINLAAQSDASENMYNPQKFLKSDIGQRLQFVEELSKEDKEHVIEVLTSWIKTLAQEFSKSNIHNIELLIKVKKDIENTNLNVRLALEYLALNLYND